MIMGFINFLLSGAFMFSPSAWLLVQGTVKSGRMEILENIMGAAGLPNNIFGSNSTEHELPLEELIINLLGQP